MTDTVIDTYSTGQVDLEANDTLWVLPVGSIVRSGVSVVWTLDVDADVPPGVVIVNEGMIASTGDRAIETSGDQQEPDGALSFNLSNHGTVTSSADDAIKLDNLPFGGSILVDNFGEISTTGTGGSNGQALDFDKLDGAATITIVNHFDGVIKAADADAIRPGEGGVVTNHGLIYGGAEDPTDGNDGIDFQSHETGEVHNDGHIEGTRHGITGDLKDFFVENDGEIVGDRGSGINLDLPDAVTPTDYVATVVNHGLIEGNAEGDQDGDGIDTDGLLNLDNYGAIRAFGTWNAGLSEAVTIGGGTINNYAGGEITSVQRAITVDNSDGGSAYAATQVWNAGLISSDTGDAIHITGDFADTITNAVGGRIPGSIFTDGGADQITLYTGSSVSGLIDGGADDDTITLAGNGTGDLLAVDNVENLVVQGGTWFVRATEAYSSGIVIGDGATLVAAEGAALGGDINVAGRFVIESNGVSFVGQEISGAGQVEITGGGYTVLENTNSYSGGTLLTDGTLEVAAFEAAGTGDIVFAAGSQSLVIGDDALSAFLLGANASFENTIVGFGEGDSIDLAGLQFAAGAKVHYDAGTATMTVTSYGVSVELTVVDPGAAHFTAEGDGAGGTRIIVKDEGVAIHGTQQDDVVAADQTVFGRPLPTGADDVIRGRAGDDHLAGLGGNDRILGDTGDDRIRAAPATT